MEERQIEVEPVNHLLQRHRHRDWGVLSKTPYTCGLTELRRPKRGSGGTQSRGHVEEDVIAAPGEEVVQFAEEHLYKDGLWEL